MKALAAVMVLALASACASSPPEGPGGPGAPTGLGAETVALCSYGGAAIRAFMVGRADAPRRVVLVHGWTGSGAEFLWLARAMTEAAPDVLCVCVDLPGSGSSDKPADAAYDVPYFRAVLHGILEASAAWGLPEGEAATDLTLVGHSLGGHFSADYAAVDGRLVSRIGLIAPAGWPAEVGDFMAWASKNGLAIAVVPEFINEGSYMATHKARIMYNKDRFPEEATRYAARAIATPAGRAALRAVTERALETDHVDGELGSIAVPVFMTWGRDDKALDFSFAAKFLAALPPGAVFLPFERCGHLPHCEYPAELSAALLAFMSAVPGDAPAAR